MRREWFRGSLRAWLRLMAATVILTLVLELVSPAVSYPPNPGPTAAEEQQVNDAIDNQIRYEESPQYLNSLPPPPVPPADTPDSPPGSPYGDHGR